MPRDNIGPQPPEVTAAKTVDAIVEASKRPRDVPLRREFLQSRDNSTTTPGPLGDLVAAGDHRGVLLFLLLLTKASSEPWDAALPSTVWARALGIALPESKSARSSISKVWLRLERRNLITRSRKERLADVFLMREDGSGQGYTNPGDIGETYFRFPLALWLEGPDENRRWFQVLSLPELAVFLIGRSLGDQFWLPFESAPDWYGISADTAARGVAGLGSRGLLETSKEFKTAPLSAVGYTARHRYTLQPPMGPVGHISGAGRSVRTTGGSSISDQDSQETPAPAKRRKKKPKKPAKR